MFRRGSELKLEQYFQTIKEILDLELWGRPIEAERGKAAKAALEIAIIYEGKGDESQKMDAASCYSLALRFLEHWKRYADVSSTDFEEKINKKLTEAEKHCEHHNPPSCSIR